MSRSRFGTRLSKDVDRIDDREHRIVSRLRSLLADPLSARLCVLGWFIASSLFVLLVRMLGGPTPNDALESLFSTWAIAHGHLSCAYPDASTDGYPLIAPTWPLLSGGVASLSGIGHGAAFPPSSAMGPHCSSAIDAMYRWSVRSHAESTSLKLGYLSWFPLMAGTIAFLRTTVRGRSGWEPATLMMMACCPPIFMCLSNDFHPQDLVTMGLVLFSLACVRKDSWVWAGALLGFAVDTQQFAMLVLVPLLVVVPSKQRFRFALSVIAAIGIVDMPIVVATSGRAIRAVFIGSGNTPSIGGTILGELHLHGASLVIASRVFPVAVAILVAAWMRRRYALTILDPETLLVLVGISLSCRLIFEQNLFGYYFSALAAVLVILDVLRGRIRWQLIMWLALLALAFNPLKIQSYSEGAPLWLWQIALVGGAVYLAFSTLKPSGVGLMAKGEGRSLMMEERLASSFDTISQGAGVSSKSPDEHAGSGTFRAAGTVVIQERQQS